MTLCCYKGWGNWYILGIKYPLYQKKVANSCESTSQMFIYLTSPSATPKSVFLIKVTFIPTKKGYNVSFLFI
jgi:hypothetical protein